VDDASIQDEVLRSWALNIGQIKPNLYIRTSYHRWFTRASNLGLRLVRTPWAVLLNADTILSKGWLDELYEVKRQAEEQNLKVGLVGHESRCGYDEMRWVNKEDTNYVTGHCYLLNMQAMEEMAAARGTPGWYFNEQDPEQIQYKADVHVCWDLRALGWATIGCYNNSVYHAHGGCGRSGWDPDKIKIEDVTDCYTNQK